MAAAQRGRPRCPLADWPARTLDWLCEGRSDYRAFRQRRQTRVYRENRARCLYVWVVVAGLLLLCGSAPCLILFGLVGTLVCLSLLDPD